MFIVKFVSEKPEGDTVYGLGVLYSLGFRGAFLLLKLFPTISINKCHLVSHFVLYATLDLSWLLQK